MARVKTPAARRHRKLLSKARGFKQSRQRRIKVAKDALLHAGQYAYEGRKKRKRDLRALWIIRLNAAVRQEGMSYSKFIAGLKSANIEIDRKVLSDIAARDAETFKKIFSQITK